MPVRPVRPFGSSVKLSASSCSRPLILCLLRLVSSSTTMMSTRKVRKKSSIYSYSTNNICRICCVYFRRVLWLAARLIYSTGWRTFSPPRPPPSASSSFRVLPHIGRTACFSRAGTGRGPRGQCGVRGWYICIFYLPKEVAPCLTSSFQLRDDGQWADS